MGMFIEVSVDNSVVSKAEGAAQKIIESCPVKIFAAGEGPGSLKVVEDNTDECTLCDLCSKASSGVKVTKLYE